MRTTLILDDELINEAMRLVNKNSKTEVIHLGLKALIQKETQKRLISLGGKDKTAKAPPRRRG